MKLLYKFILVITAVSVLPLAFLGVRMIEANRSALEENIQNTHIITAANLADRIDSFMESLTEKLLFLINSQSVEYLDYRGKQALVQSFLSSSKHFVAVSLVNRYGDEFIKTYHPDYSSEAVIENISETEVFRQAADGPAVGSVYRSEGEPRMDIVSPIGHEYIMIRVTLARIWEELLNIDIGRDAFAFLVDSSGRVLAHPDPSVEDSGLEIPPVEAVLARAGTGVMEFGDPERKTVSAYAPVASMGWGVVTSQPHRLAYSSVYRMRENAYRLIFSVFLVAVILSVLLARGLSRPVLSIIKGAEAVSSGDFSQEVRVKSRDELRDLAGTFNEMVRSLKRYDEMQIEKIISERAKTKAIVFSIDDGILLTDHEGRLMLINSRARELLDIREELPEGVFINDFIESQELKRVFNGFMDSEVSLSSGSTRKVLKVNSEDIKISSGKKLGRMRVIRDITLEKEIEEMKERFIQSVTHDLKNPLSAVKGISSVLEEMRGGNISEQEKKYFRVLQSETSRLMGMIDDILTLAKIESGNMKLENKKFDLRELLSEMREIFSVMAASEGIKIKLDPGGPVKVKADRELIRRVLVNLIGNALRHTPENGRITLFTRPAGDRVETGVSDTGEGIPREMIERIFERFQRVEYSGKGSGIGLHVSKEIIEAHGGDIWAESEPGRGAEFIFSLPVDKGAV